MGVDKNHGGNQFKKLIYLSCMHPIKHSSIILDPKNMIENAIFMSWEVNEVGEDAVLVLVEGPIHEHIKKNKREELDGCDTKFQLLVQFMEKD